MEKEGEKIGLVVIDSSIFIDHLRSYPPALEFFNKLSFNPQNVLFSAITETELIKGKSCSDNNVRSLVINMLNGLSKIPVDNMIALKAGDLSRIYGTDMPDSIIAATAIICKAELLTRNVKDFEKIDGLKVRSPY